MLVLLNAHCCKILWFSKTLFFLPICLTKIAVTNLFESGISHQCLIFIISFIEFLWLRIPEKSLANQVVIKHLRQFTFHIPSSFSHFFFTSFLIFISVWILFSLSFWGMFFHVISSMSKDLRWRDFLELV